MGDVNLGSVKAKLELDASTLDRSVQQATDALKRLGASSEQTAKYLEEMMKVPGEYRDAFNAALIAQANAVENLGNKIKETKGFLDGFSDTFKKGLLFGGAFEIGRKSAELLLGGIKDLGAGIVDLVKRGSEVEKIASSFDALSASVGQSSVAMLKAAQEGSRGLITNYDLMASANKAMMLGLPITAKEMGTLTTVATALGRAMGQDATKSFNDLIVGVGRGSTKILDNIGIVVKAKDAYEAYATAHDTTVQAMTQAERVTAMYSATITAAEARVASLGEVSLTAAERLQTIKVAWSNFTEELGRSIQTNTELLVGLDMLSKALTGKTGTTFIEEVNIHLSNMVRWIVTAQGAWDGFKARMASPTKEGGILEGASKALAEFDKKVEEEKKKQNLAGLKNLGKEMFPSVFALNKPSTGEGGAEDKRLQAEIDKLSGKKAQEEIDRITAAVKRLGLDGVADVDALGKRLVTLGSEGAKVPEKLMGTWSDAFIKEASKVGKLPTNADSLKKSIADAYKVNSKTISDALKADEEAWKNFEKTRAFINKETEDIIQVQLRDGTLSIGEQYKLREQQIIASTQTQIDAIRRMADATTDPAQRAALEELIKQWEKIRDKELEATKEAQRYAQVSKLFQDFSDVLGGISDVFDAIGISADSTISKIVSGLQTAAASVEDFSRQTTTAGKVGSGLSAVANIYKTGQQKGAAAGALSGAATGAGIGFMVGGPVGAGVGAVAGAVVGLIGGLRKPEYKKIMADIGKSWGVNISEGLAKEIEQIAKTNKISRSLAELLDVSKIMGESGKDPRTFTRQIGDLMNAIKSGAVPAAQGMEELGKAFNMVADAAVKSGTVGDRALVGLIKRARELGQITPEMKAFVGEQLNSALEGIHKYVAGIEAINKAATATPEELSKIGATSGVVFGAMFNALVSEKGIVGAVDAMKGDFDALNKTLTDTLGPEATAQILGPFGAAFDTINNENLRPIFDGIDGITQAMTGLANAGYLSVDQFGAMQDATAQLFDQAIAGGADTKTALLAVAPGIQAAISAAEQFGVPLDADMARLKEMAEQNGITFKTDPQAAMLDVLVSIAQVLGADVPESARRAQGAMQDLANSVPHDLDVNLNVHENRTYSGGGGGGGETPAEASGGGGGGTEIPPPPEYIPGRRYDGYQHGTGGVMDFGQGTPVVLHGREAVVTEKQAQQMGDNVNVTFNATFNVDPLQSNAARNDLAQFVIDEFIRQARTSPMIRQLLRKDGGRG